MNRYIWTELNDEERRALLRRPAAQSSPEAAASVRGILDDVRRDGGNAVRALTQKFDGFDPEPLFVEQKLFDLAEEEIGPDLCEAIALAYKNIRRFHRQQGTRGYAMETMPGLTCARNVVPVQRIGLYIPGGTAPLLSTVLMLGVPSQIAGCPDRLLCTPGDRSGNVHPAILYAARLCGIEKIARIGGAQAIAGMAYGSFGTPVDKIFGPGNLYVTLAKQQVAQEIGGPAIDMPAGPSEILVIVEEKTPDAYAAADLLAQAEHDPASQVVLIALSMDKIERVLGAVEAQIKTLPRAGIVRAALANSVAIVASSLEMALDISNLYAPEHLILSCADAERLLPLVTNAGSVFCGIHTPESRGDYASGTNHVLPTAGTARAYSGVGVEAFQKTITWQLATPAALAAIGPSVEALARAETLEAHARAIAVRLGRVA